MEWIERSLHPTRPQPNVGLLIYLSKPWANPFLTAEAELSDLPDGQISDFARHPRSSPV